MKRYAVLLLLVALHLSFSAFAAETARSEWMRGYVKMESGDRNAATKPNEALGQYREALEIFERVRRKYPTWNESLLNYRIKYCKEQIEKLATPWNATETPRIIEWNSDWEAYLKEEADAKDIMRQHGKFPTPWELCEKFCGMSVADLLKTTQKRNDCAAWATTRAAL